MLSATQGLRHRRVSLYRRLKAHLGAGNADILHIHNPFGYYLYGALAARLTGGTQVVQTLHATVMFDRNARKGAGRFAVERTKALFWAAAMLTDGLVSVCSEAEANIRHRFLLRGNRLFVVENGIEMARFLAVPNRQPRDEIVVGAVGRMSSEKNHRILIQAVALVRRNHSNVRLRLLGDGPLEPKLKKLVRNLGLDDIVQFFGFSNDVAGFMGGLDIFALPSNSEALPLSLLEAIASGLPVVATAVGGVPRILQNTGCGWLCPAENPGALAQAIESAIASPNLMDRGERARQLVAERYAVERMAHDYERLYQRLLDKDISNSSRFHFANGR
jgi:glycosyltransferase involved in cell wall biosynthesis